MSLSATAASTVEVIIINKPDSEKDQRYNYPQRLLKTILAITEGEYGPAVIKQADTTMPRNRTLVELSRGVFIHVMAEAPKPGWESQLIPVRIPIRKGIQGYRTFLILKKNQAMLSRIDSLDELKKIPTGSAKQWSTTRVLKENGFNIKLSNSYKSLFSMLEKERFITFGRGINEIQVEYDEHKGNSPELAIEQDLLLYIPLPTYFFVTPTKPQLAKRIKLGLLAMIRDGSFDEMFMEEFGELIKNANLSQRKIFSINNPNLSDETPLEVEHYWYKP